MNNTNIICCIRISFVALYYLAFFLESLVLKRSTRPALSINFALPVKKGWQAEQTSTSVFSLVEPTVVTFPQAHLIWAFGKYLGERCFGGRVGDSDVVFGKVVHRLVLFGAKRPFHEDHGHVECGAGINGSGLRFAGAPKRGP